MADDDAPTSEPGDPAGPDPFDGNDAPDDKPGNDAPDEDETPPAGDEFDAEKAKAALRKKNSENANLRKRLKELEPLADEAKQLRDSKKTAEEKLNERATAAEQRAAAAELASMRLDVALDNAPEGMPVSKIRALAKRLTGKDREELEADAKELFAEFAPAKADPKADDKGDGPEKVRLPNSDRLKVDDEVDPKKLAAGIRRL